MTLKVGDHLQPLLEDELVRARRLRAARYAARADAKVTARADAAAETAASGYSKQRITHNIGSVVPMSGSEEDELLEAISLEDVSVDESPTVGTSKHSKKD